MNMHASDFAVDWLVQGFAPISLEDLNEKAAMLARIDNKYVVDRIAVERVLPQLLDHFDILQIGTKRAFGYHTQYFDDARRSAYYEHHQGLRKGFKVRVRRYADAGLCFMEVKVKGRRGMTLKHRLPYDTAHWGGLTDEARRFAADTYCEHYGKPFAYDLGRALDIRYQRITLVAKSGGERVTLDANLKFFTPEKTLAVAGDVLIAEIKSDNGRGFADKCLRAIGARPTRKCSKYCVGMAALGEVTRWNRFMPTMRQLRLVEGTRLAQQPLLLASAA